MIRRGAVLWLTLVLAGCAAPAGLEEPTEARASSNAAGSAAASRDLSPSELLPIGAPVRLRVMGDGPVVDGETGPEGYRYDLPGAVVEDTHGTYHLFITWFGEQPGDQIVTVSTSASGTDWEVGTTPIYDDLGLHTRPPGPVPTAALLVDGEWVLYGWAARPTSQRINFTWRATAPAPDGPWTPEEEAVLDLGPLGGWDDAGAAATTVHTTADGFELWYDGFSEEDDRGSIGYASSADGITWTRVPTPVVEPGACGTTTDAGVFLPSVLEWDGQLLMVFGGLLEERGDPFLFGATSTDGVTWTCAGDGPLTGLEQFSDEARVHSFEGFALNGQPVILLEVFQEDHTELWLAAIEPA
jgi:hypothetical protein